MVGLSALLSLVCEAHSIVPGGQYCALLVRIYSAQRADWASDDHRRSLKSGGRPSTAFHDTISFTIGGVASLHARGIHLQSASLLQTQYLYETKSCVTARAAPCYAG